MSYSAKTLLQFGCMSGSIKFARDGTRPTWPFDRVCSNARWGVPGSICSSLHRSPFLISSSRRALARVLSVFAVLYARIHSFSCHSLSTMVNTIEKCMWLVLLAVFVTAAPIEGAYSALLELGFHGSRCCSWEYKPSPVRS